MSRPPVRASYLKQYYQENAGESGANRTHMNVWILKRSVIPTASSKFTSSKRGPLSALPSRSNEYPLTRRIAFWPRWSATSTTSNKFFASVGRADLSLLLFGFFHGA